MRAETKSASGRTRGPRGRSCGDEEHGCEIVELFRVLGKTYMLDLLHIFLVEGNGPKRFHELQDRLKISPNTLSDRLKEMVGAGLLTRKPYNEIPPRVDYEATAKAHDLKEVFEVLIDWAAKHDLQASPTTPEEARASA